MHVEWSLTLILLLGSSLVLALETEELPPTLLEVELKGPLLKENKDKTGSSGLTAVSSTVIPVMRHENRTEGDARFFFFPSSRRLGIFEKGSKPERRVRLITKNRKLKDVVGSGTEES